MGLAAKLTILREPDLDQAVQAALTRTSPNVFSYLNLHVLHQATKHKALQEALNAADEVYCDSDGLRIWLDWKRKISLEKLTGADFMPDLLGRMGREGVSIFLLGGEKESVEKARMKIETMSGGITVLGHHHGYFDEAESDRMIETVNRLKPQLLLVGLGTPRQEVWVHRYRHRLRVPLIWCVGAWFDYLSGKEKRAPTWMLRHNLEWLFRWGQHPRGHTWRVVWEIPLFFLRQIGSPVRVVIREPRTEKWGETISLGKAS